MTAEPGPSGTLGVRTARAMIPQTSSAIASRPSTIGITRPMTRAMRVPPTPTSPIATSPAPAQVMVTS
ncbi:hypothetical protein CIK70_05175 [Brachybacterium alimentarium]|nr:hypothetical protein CIK70_05175 [Brachybacterium alimentarium]